MTTFTPSRNLPVDVLCEIFKYYIEEDHRGRPPSLMRSPKDLPWFLGQVCRLWRMAAIVTPQLWDRFPPFKITPTNESLDSDLMFNELLKRLGTRSIYAQFDCARYSPGTSNHIKSRPVLTSLLATSKKWERATIRCPDVRSLEYYFRDIKGCIPCLRRVELLFPLNCSGGRSLEEGLTIFHDSPKLSELLLHDLPVILWGRLPDIPWEQLTRIQYYGGGKERFYQVLKRAVNLDTFMGSAYNFCPDYGSLLKHPKIRQLQFYISKIGTLFPLSLDELETPALEILVVDFEPTARFTQDAVLAVTSLLVRSQCKLKHLVLGYPYLAVDVLGVLVVAPDLETLELGDCNGLNEVLLLLVPGDSGPCLLPNLRALTLLFPTTMDSRLVTTIQRIVESRTSLEGRSLPSLFHSTLQSVRLRINHQSTRFQACLDLNKDRPREEGENPDNPQPVVDSTEWSESDVPSAANCEALLGDFLSQIESPELSITQQRDRAADAMRLAHVFNTSDRIRSKLLTLRKICQPLVTDEFIKTCEWMLAGKEDIVYIHPEHELRNSPNRRDIVFGLFDAGPESLEGYYATEFSVERREWWNV